MKHWTINREKHALSHSLKIEMYLKIDDNQKEVLQLIDSLLF